MSEIDWSKAPEGYPVYIKGIDLNYASGWYKELDDRYVSERGIYYMKRDSGIFTSYRKPSPTWSGEALPPIGCEVCVVDNGSLRYGVGEQGPVVARVEDCAVVRMSYGLGCFESSVLSPIRTPEQIAKDEREAAIKEMLEDAGRPDTAKTRDQAQMLYDAGWRKVERAQ